SSTSFITTGTGCSGGCTGMQYVVNQLIATGYVLGISWLDEVTGTWASQPLQGPLTPSPSGTIQSPLLNVTVTGSPSSTCTANFTTSVGEGAVGWLADNKI